jgi:thiosulfate/3-mercaptopyruvate sulfurtransferase
LQTTGARQARTHLPADPEPQLSGYAHPHRVVTADWLTANLGNPKLAIVEADRFPQLYFTGHVPGAVSIDCQRDLDGSRSCERLSSARFAQLMDIKGINRDQTVVIYGDDANSCATQVFAAFASFGHYDVRLLQGGRDGWASQGRALSLVLPSSISRGYPRVPRHPSTITDHIERRVRNGVLLDVCSGVKSRARVACSDETLSVPLVIERSHVLAIPWTTAIDRDGRFRPQSELAAAYQTLHGSPCVVVYSHERAHASHTWFVLTCLLGLAAVHPYEPDGPPLRWCFPRPRAGQREPVIRP